MKKSIIAVVAAMGVAFVATSAVADDNANPCDRTWQDCAFAVEEGGFNKPSKKAGVPEVDKTPQWMKDAFEPKGEDESS